MNPESLIEIWHTLDFAKGAGSGLTVHAIGPLGELPEVCVGIDQGGRRHLLIPRENEFDPKASFNTAGLSGTVRPLFRDNTNLEFLDLVCNSRELDGVFANLSAEILETIATAQESPASTAMQVLGAWQSLFGAGAQHSGIEQVIGLVGELQILYWLTRDDPAALLSWDGPEGGVHDFRNETSALEVKSSLRRYGKTVAVSSLHQLLPPTDCSLNLAFLRFEKHAAGELSIPRLLTMIRGNGVNPSLLNEKIKKLGIDEAVLQSDANRRFSLLERRLFRVEEGFPRIIPTSFVGGEPPEGLVGVSYIVDLGNCSEYELSISTADTCLNNFAIAPNP